MNKKNLYKIKFKPTTLGRAYEDLNNIPNPVTYEICGLLSEYYTSAVQNEPRTMVRNVQSMVLCDHDNSDCSNCPFVIQNAMLSYARASNNRGYIK